MMSDKEITCLSKCDTASTVGMALKKRHGTTTMLRSAIATQTRPKSRPWNQHSSKIYLSLLEQVKAGNTLSKIQTCFHEIISNKYSNHKQTYTDDSMFDGKVGYGVENNSTNISSSLPSTWSILCRGLCLDDVLHSEPFPEQ